MPSPRQQIERLDAERDSRVAPAVFDLSKVFYDKQLPFGRAKARLQTACCTRRSGKTVADCGKLLDVAREKPGSVGLYITLSRVNAKRLAWEILKSLNAEWRLGGVPSEGELCMTMPNGSRVYLTGCADMGEVEKFRGLPLAIVIIDEAQSFPTVMLEKLIDEVLMPALMDFAGILVLAGTPGPVPVGYYHRQVISPEYEHFAFSVFDNPWIQKKSGKTPRELLDEELKRRGVDESDPVIRREWFGEWVLDTNSLVFRFDPKTNTRELPPFAGRDNYHQHHVIGLDFGFDDADAIDVLGWSDSAREVDLVHEWVGSKQNITALCERVRKVYDKYKPLAVVADTGGLGKKIADEITMRTGIPLEAADKQQKLAHIEWVNDALRTHQLFVPADSRFAQDALLVEWDKSNPEKPKISERFHSDTADGLLYAFVKALHWLHVPALPPAPKVGTVEWREQEAKRQESEIEAMLQQDIKAAQERRQSEDDIRDLL